MTDVTKVIELLSLIEEDISVPRNVKTKVQTALSTLQAEPNGKSVALLCDKVLQELDELSDDPNLPAHTRTQIWNVVSTLEST